jgi:broad specificity phosphatase PhoE
MLFHVLLNQPGTGQPPRESHQITLAHGILLTFLGGDPHLTGQKIAGFFTVIGPGKFRDLLFPDTPGMYAQLVQALLIRLMFYFNLRHNKPHGVERLMQVYFMRHGQTNYNRQLLCNDDPTKDVHLTSAGTQQAQRAAEKLKHVPLEKIIVSELPRTRQTADIINQYHQVGIESCATINDLRSGFDSQPVTDYLSAIAHDRLHASANGGESLIQHRQRILGFLEWLQQQKEDCLLVVAHEETLRVAYAWANQLDDEAMMEQEFNNCEWFEFNLAKR